MPTGSSPPLAVQQDHQVAPSSALASDSAVVSSDQLTSTTIAPIAISRIDELRTGVLNNANADLSSNLGMTAAAIITDNSAAPANDNTYLTSARLDELRAVQIGSFAISGTDLNAVSTRAGPGTTIASATDAIATATSTTTTTGRLDLSTASGDLSTTTALATYASPDVLGSGIGTPTAVTVTTASVGFNPALLPAASSKTAPVVGAVYATFDGYLARTESWAARYSTVVVALLLSTGVLILSKRGTFTGFVRPRLYLTSA
jgi:hypothetical protein